MNTLLALAWATAVLGIILATISIIATSRARRRWNEATEDLEAATVRTDRVRRHYEIERTNLKQKQNFPLIRDTPKTPLQEKLTSATDALIKRDRKPGLIPSPVKHASHIQPRNDAADALGGAILGAIIAQSTVINHVPDQITVTDAPAPEPSPSTDTSSSTSWDSGSSSSSSSSWDSGSSSSYDSGSSSSYSDGGGSY